MTPSRRWRSSKTGPSARIRGRVAWWISCLAVSVALILLSPFGSSSSVSVWGLSWASHGFLPLIVWAFCWISPWHGGGLVAWATLLVGMTALSSRVWGLLWLPLEFGLLGFGVQACLKRWQGALTAQEVKRGRLEERINTLEEELRQMDRTVEGLKERLHRYQRLRQVAHTFSQALSLDDLIQCILKTAGEMLQAADRVLLYLVNPQTLGLELQSVWRRIGSDPIKAKTGDPFDLWVMRQGQPLLVPDPARDFRFSQVETDSLGRSLGSLLAVPLATEVRLIGVLRVESIRPQGLGDPELRLARIIGDLASLEVENCRLFHRMEELAITDDLTGLSVRAHFQKRLSEEIARSKALQMPVSVLLIDIDRFKGYNDTFGHSAGDKLLKQLARILLSLKRQGEVAARFGGEEFVLLLPGVDAKEAARRAEEIRSSVQSSPVELRRSFTETTVSIGTASFPQEGGTPEELLKAADERLYRAKAMGRNQVCAA